MKHKLSKTRRQQLDDLIRAFNTKQPTPSNGWLSEIRRAVGLTRSQVAEKLKASPSTIADFERNEANGTITLNSLRRVANAMDCELIYAVVPRAGSLDTQLKQRAQAVARRLIKGVTHNMALEDQQPEPEYVQRQINELADELVRTLSSELWKQNL